MTIRTKEGQGMHDRAVAAWANAVIQAGWSYVRSDLVGGERPPEINGHIPDVYAWNVGKEYVIEVETADSVNTEHAKSQAAAFRRWVAESPTSRTFEVRMA